VRESDTVARLGGDEFTVLLPQVADRESAAIVARKIIAAFAEPFVLGGHELQSSTSIGIALYPLDTEDCDKLVKCADSAMYEAKQQGRNRYCFFDASSESL
jgi:diguanylate cyclase (GGDEF)-like protein